MRDLDANPYTEDEKRVGKFIDRLTNESIGWGDDPIGFLLASYEFMRAERNSLAREVERLQKS